jgi:AAA+ ATPase superfamily predicted ATPase
MNPFKYGGVVSGEFFYNRVDDVKKIKADIQNGNNLIMYAPRRYGKTSLIIKILSELENESINTIYIDFFNVIDQKKFLEIYSIKVLQKQKLSVEKAITQFRSFVRNLVPSVTFDKDGNTSFQIKFQENIGVEKSFEDVVNLPEKMAGGKKWVIVFDEFQEINRLNGDNFEQQLRAVIQFH